MDSEFFRTLLEMAGHETVAAIVTSTDRLHEELADVRSALEVGFEDLEHAFTFGLSAVAWRHEQSNQLLTNILSALKAPRKTRADEARVQGDEYYRNALASQQAIERRKWMDLA